VIRVDVSVDGGKTWEVAHIKHGAAPPGNYSRNWTWALWELEVPLEALRGKEGGQGQVEIVAKATDTSYNVQPERIEPYWNLRGVMTNHWPRVTVEMPQPAAQEAAAVAAH
jgi:sulfite oxidase